MSEGIRGRLLLHVYDPSDWTRPRRDHPTDPGWEVGTYSACHEKVRRNAEIGDWIVDTIVFKDTHDKYIGIRSIFQVTEVRNGVLFFDRYWFAKGPKPIRLTKGDLRKLLPGALKEKGKDEILQMCGIIRNPWNSAWIRRSSLGVFVKKLMKRMVLKKPTMKSRSAKSSVCQGCVKK